MHLVLLSAPDRGVQTVLDVMTPADGLTIEQTFPGDVLGRCVEADDTVFPRWTTTDGGKTFVAWAPPAAPVPTSCTKLGLKRVLAETGADAVFSAPEWPAVKALLAQDADLQEDWDLAVEVRRTDPLVQGVIAARGYDAVTVDKILVRAAALAP